MAMSRPMTINRTCRIAVAGAGIGNHGDRHKQHTQDPRTNGKAIHGDVILHHGMMV